LVLIHFSFVLFVIICFTNHSKLSISINQLIIGKLDQKHHKFIWKMENKLDEKILDEKKKNDIQIMEKELI